MKKIKLLPSMLLLVLCLAVLGVGIYAAQPASNTISGTVTVTAANVEIQIDVYKDSVAEGNRVATSVTTRTSANITLSPLSFVRTAEAVAADGVGATNSLAEADSVSEVAPIVLIFKVTNTSLSKDLGVYFSETAQTVKLASATPIKTSTTFDGVDAGENTYTDLVSGAMTGYEKITANSSTNMTLTLTLTALQESEISVVLTNNIFLNVEEFQSAYEANDLVPDLAYLKYDATQVNGQDFGWYIEMGEGEHWNGSAWVTSALRWIPIAREGKSTLVEFEDEGTGISLWAEMTVSSDGSVPEYIDITTGANNETKNGLSNKLKSDTYTFILASGYRFKTVPASGSNGLPYYLFDDSSSYNYSTSEVRTFISDSNKLSTHWGINTSTDVVYNAITSTTLNEEILIYPESVQYSMSEVKRGGTGDYLYASCTSEKLFLLSVLEVICQYKYFADTTSNRAYNCKSNGSASDWWLRSPDPQFETSAISVYTSGDLFSQGLSNTQGVAVRPAFKIAL